MSGSPADGPGDMVTVIVPTVRDTTIGDTLEALLRQTYRMFEVLVMAQGDNARLVETIRAFAARDDRVRLVHLARGNRNAALNHALGEARGTIVSLTDDDCEPAPDWLEQVQRHFAEHPDVGVVGGEVVAPPSRRPWWPSSCPSAHAVEVVYYPSRSGYRAPPDMYMLGANTSFRRWAIDRIGRFDETLGPGTPFPSCEDLDYLIRAEALDIPMLVTKKVLVVHTHGRRYGVREVLKHQRNYNRGRGAYLVKLQMMGHRLGDEWSAHGSRLAQIPAFVRNPPRYALELFGAHHRKAASHEYRAGYVVADGNVGRPLDIAA